MFEKLRRRRRAVGSTTSPRGIQLYADATEKDFDPLGYLFVNEDVAAAAQTDDRLAFAREHFAVYGQNEGRKQLLTSLLPAVVEARTGKMEALYARSPGSRRGIEPYTAALGDATLTLYKARDEARVPVPFERVSAHDYDEPMQAWFDENPSSLFLDVGAGSRPLYRPNVVYAEIAALPSTDILCFGDKLPFDDDVFDGVVALAVLEHVEDPFEVAAELVRVTRPNGQVVVDWPFLVPVHAYPHHYYNATPQGAQLAFERMPDVSSVRSSVPSFLHPVYTLRWMLDEWIQSLPEEQKADFAELRVADILAEDSEQLEMKAWSRLPTEKKRVICAGTRVVATKRARSALSPNGTGAGD